VIWQEILPSYQAFLSPERAANPNPSDQLTITKQNKKAVVGEGEREQILNCLGGCWWEYGGGFPVET